MKTTRTILAVVVISTATARVCALGCTTPTPTPTPSSTPTPMTTPTSTPTPSPSPTPDPPPKPPPLANAQNPVNYGADPTGVNNSAAGFQSAIDMGDLDVPAGMFRIDSSVYVLDDRNIRCEPGSALLMTTIGNLAMFQWNDSTKGSVFNCRFRGINYNKDIPSFSSGSQDFLFIQSIGGHGGG